MIADKNNYAKSIGLVGAFLEFFPLENADGMKICISLPISFGDYIFQLGTSVIPWLVP
jgi:hypothetical protein